MSIQKIVGTFAANINRLSSLRAGDKAMEKNRMVGFERMNELFESLKAGTLDNQSREEFVTLCIKSSENLVKSKIAKYPQQFHDTLLNAPYDTFVRIEQIANGTRKSIVQPDEIRNFSMFFFNTLKFDLLNKMAKIDQLLSKRKDVDDFYHFITKHETNSPQKTPQRHLGVGMAESPAEIVIAREKLAEVIKASEKMPKGMLKILKTVIKNGSSKYDPSSGLSNVTWRSNLHYMRKWLSKYIEN